MSAALSLKIGEPASRLDANLPQDIHLDANANVAPTPGVSESVLEALTTGGNPSSPHGAGETGRQILARARDAVASLVEGALPENVVFTSGCTEANNQVVASARAHQAHLVTTVVEHPSLLRAADAYRALGGQLTLLPVDAQGQLQPIDLEGVLERAEGLVFVSVQAVNSETGVRQPWDQIVRIARRRSHTLLPELEDGPLAALRHELFTRAAQLSGGVVMRGAQWGNYAHELLGLVLTQRELERLLTADRESRTGWFFLDDYREFLDLTGEMADILALDFSQGPEGREIRLVLAEAKYAGRDSLHDQRKRSFSQLESTFTALRHRLLDLNASLDPGIWRNRLADMVLEHMEPFDQIAGWSQGEWLEALRRGAVPLRLEGYSLVFSHDAEPWAEVLPSVADEVKPAAERRQMAQWAFDRPTTAQALRDLARPDARPLISRPTGWPAAYQTPPADDGGGLAAEPEPPAPQPPPAPTVLESAPDVEAPTAVADEAPEPAPAASHAPPPSGPWSQAILAVLQRLSRARVEADGEAWLEEQIIALRGALQAEGMDAPVQGSRLTPNTGLVYVGGRALTISWLERRQTDLLTRYGLDIVRITPLAGRIAIGLRRPTRAILHLADAWLRRQGDAQDDAERMAPLLGEKEDDGALCFLPLAKEFAGQEVAAPHSVISGTTGSGKGILVTNLILDLCALNSPRALDLYLIDPKRGVDYAWARRLPHLKAGIIDDQSEALARLSELVDEMDVRYEQIAAEGCRNIDHFNRKVEPERRLPRIVIFFDEVANWMQDDEFKSAVDGLINKIATKARAAGFHLFMIYQRADNQVMTMQLRTNLGNKLILRLGDEGSSKIALGERGAERLLGKGHLIGKLGTDEKVYMQVPYIGDDEVDELAEAVIATWSGARGRSHDG